LREACFKMIGHDFSFGSLCFIEIQT